MYALLYYYTHTQVAKTRSREGSYLLTGREQGSGLVLQVRRIALRLLRDAPALLGHEEEGDELPDCLEESFHHLSCVAAKATFASIKDA